MGSCSSSTPPVCLGPPAPPNPTARLTHLDTIPKKPSASALTTYDNGPADCLPHNTPENVLAQNATNWDAPVLPQSGVISETAASVAKYPAEAPCPFITRMPCSSDPYDQGWRERLLQQSAEATFVRLMTFAPDAQYVQEKVPVAYSANEPPVVAPEATPVGEAPQANEASTHTQVAIQTSEAPTCAQDGRAPDTKPEPDDDDQLSSATRLGEYAIMIGDTKISVTEYCLGKRPRKCHT